MVISLKTSPTQRWNFDAHHVENHIGLIGIDEAGRGCFAGPVVAACVCLKANFYEDKKIKKQCKEFTDSKQIPADLREELLIRLQTWEKEDRLNFAWATASALEIDQYNIFVATQIAMQRTLETLCKKDNAQAIVLPQYNHIVALPLFTELNLTNDQKEAASKTLNTHYKILIDGRPIKKFLHPHQGIIKGDAKSLIIAMASIIAKTQRDSLLRDLDKTYPQYGFASHKGYGTAEHQEALGNHGPCAEHRQTFLKKFNKHRELQEELLFDENE